MAESARELKYKLQDTITPNPAERAAYIWNHLREHQPDLTDWDLICFCAEFTGQMSTQWPWLKEVAIAFMRLIYLAHYESDAVKNDNSIVRSNSDSQPTGETETGESESSEDSPESSRSEQDSSEPGDVS